MNMSPEGWEHSGGIKRLVKKLLLLALIVVIGLAAYFIRGVVAKAIPVQTIEVNRGDLVVTVTATTTSTIESERMVSVPSRRNGVVETLALEEGDFVKKGGLIAALDKRDANAELRRAEAAYELAKRNLDMAKSGLGMEKERTDAALKEAESVLWEAASNLERYKLLFERGLISRQDFDAAKRTHEVAKSRYDSAKANLSMYDVKVNEVEAAGAAVDEASAALEAARLQQEYCTIISPVSGVVSELPVEEGEPVAVNQTVAEVVDPEDIYILSTIDEVDVGKLKVGMPVRVHVDAVPDKLHEGFISRISPIVFGEKQETRTFEVRVRFKEKLEVLKPGMSADIEVVSREMKDVIHVPAQSVVERDGDKYVYVVVDGRAALKKVKLGYFSWSDAEIVEGLDEGDVVVTTPDAVGLTDGARVTEMPV